MNLRRPVLLLGVAAALALTAGLSAAVVSAGALNEPDTLDPAEAWDNVSTPYIANIFETLVRVDPSTAAIQPWLAESWQVLDGGRSWQFRLRANVRFHDGSPCDADAVVFTFQRQLDPHSPHRFYELPLFAEIFTALTEVRKIDDRTVRFRLRQPFAPFLACLASDCASIVSPRAVRLQRAGFRYRPVGTGPFRLLRWVRGKRLELEANPDYWHGRPQIDGFVVQFGDDIERLGAQFREGRLDMLFSYSISRIAAFKRSQSIRILAAPTLATDYLIFNCSAPPFNRRGLRRAMRLMWDERPLKLVYQDSVLPASGLLPPGMPGADAPAPATADPVAARAQLAAEGVRLPISVEYLISEANALDAQMISLYAQNLRKIGIELKLVHVGETELNRRVAAGRYQMTRSGWIADYPDADSFFYPLFSAALLRQGFANLAPMRSAAVGNLLEDGRRRSAPGERIGIYRRLQQLIRDESWLIPLSHEQVVIPYNPRLQGMHGNLLGRLYLAELSVR